MERFGGMARFKGALKCKGWVNSVITDTCMYFLNVSTM